MRALKEKESYLHELVDKLIKNGDLERHFKKYSNFLNRTTNKMRFLVNEVSQEDSTFFQRLCMKVLYQTVQKTLKEFLSNPKDEDETVWGTNTSTCSD